MSSYAQINYVRQIYQIFFPSYMKNCSSESCDFPHGHRGSGRTEMSTQEVPIHCPDTAKSDHEEEDHDHVRHYWRKVWQILVRSATTLYLEGSESCLPLIYWEYILNLLQQVWEHSCMTHSLKRACFDSSLKCHKKYCEYVQFETQKSIWQHTLLCILKQGFDLLYSFLPAKGNAFPISWISCVFYFCSFTSDWIETFTKIHLLLASTWPSL